MNPVIEKKHLRYLAQSAWTKPFRKFLYKRLPKDKPVSMLEVGCGTGVLVDCVKDEFRGKINLIAGVDLDRCVLDYAKDKTCFIAVQADGMKLPFSNESFEFVFCHYLLLWTYSPERVITEMKRVTKTGGLCAVMAEPDYGELEAKPESLARLAQEQVMALEHQGANLNNGHRLGGFFRTVGFQQYQSGCYQRGLVDRNYLVREIAQMSEDCGIQSFKIDEKVDYIYHVPTYYAYAVK